MLLAFIGIGSWEIIVILFVLMFLLIPVVIVVVVLAAAGRKKRAQGHAADTSGEKPNLGSMMTGDSKVCPVCAETVKGAALVCRFCRYDFRTS